MSKQFSQWVERNKVFINLEENKLLALVLYGESRGESWQGKIAVLNIVRNRVIETPKYSDKIIIDISGGGCLYHAVMLKKWQFSCLNFEDSNRYLLESFADNWELAISKHPILSMIYFLCCIKDHLKDNTDGANHYFTVNIKPPSWSKQMINTTTIGNHIFFKD